MWTFPNDLLTIKIQHRAKLTRAIGEPQISLLQGEFGQNPQSISGAPMWTADPNDLQNLRILEYFLYEDTTIAHFSVVCVLLREVADR